MKKILFICLIVIFSGFGFAQTIENLDYISPFNEEVAAIKKNNQWAFINKEGDIIINFRDDLVMSSIEHNKYPIFKDGRCLIVQEKDGILYYGYIDKNGEIIIEPQFLNALNFQNNIATVLKIAKNEVGENSLLGKNVVNYKYFEVSIDTNGNVLDYLTSEGIRFTLDKEFLRNPPKITHKRISNNLFAVLNENKTWTIKIITD